ncbi:MAG: molybdate ABC transporter substrate-binding protein [Bradyrhizobium sp.]
MAADIKLLSGGAMKLFMEAVTPLFERAGGHTVSLQFAPTLSQKKLIEDGAAFDLALLPREVIDDLAQQGKVTGGAIDVTRSAVGVTIRAGASKPDIATAEAFRRTLMAARTISYSDGPSGVYIASLLARLGFAEEMSAKTRLAQGRPVADLVAKGEAEIGMQQITEILPVTGAELLGPLPDELQNIIVYAAGIGTAAREADAARAFVKFLATPEVVRVMTAMGMEPG